MIIKKLYKFSYTAGTIFLILSIFMSFVPAFPVFAAQGSTKTSAGSCGAPVNKNHYTAGDTIVITFTGFEPNSTFPWKIVGNPGGASCDPGITVASGTFTTDANGNACVEAYTVQPDDCGEYSVDVEGGKGDNYRVVQDEPEPNPDFTISKSPSVSSVTAPGENVTFTIVINNTGNQAITITQVSDSVFAPGAQCEALVGTSIPAGGSASCSFVGEVTGPAGSTHTNTFEVRANSGQTTLIATDDAVVAITEPAFVEVGVVKTANPTSLMEPGGDVTFSVVVTNNSNVSATLTSLSDDKFGNLSGQGSCTLPQTLAVGASYSCSFTKEISGVAGDTHTNIITAILTSNGLSDSGQDSATVNIILAPSLGMNVVKTANPTSVQEPGGNVDFTFTVNNTSNVDIELTGLNDTVFNNLDGRGTCDVPQTISANGSYSCTITEFISANHENTVTATANYQGTPLTAQDSAAVNVVPRANPSITVEKTANPTELDMPGGSATFTVDVTNNSSFPVTINSMVDTVFGDLNGAGGCATGGSIAAGATYSCSFSRTVNAADGNPHINTVTVQVVDDLDKTASDSDDATVIFNPLPTISVTKSANPTSVSENGGVTSFTVVVNNTSNEQLTLNTLTDSVFDNLGTCSVPQILSAGGSYQCSFSAFLEGEPDAPHTNVITATATDSDGNQAQDSDNEVVTFTDVLPAITVEKTAFPTTIDEPGGFVQFTFVVTNTSKETVTLDSLIDDIYGDLDLVTGCTDAAGYSISPFDNYSCSISGQVTGDAGTVHTNTVTAVASDDDNNSTQAQDSASVTITDVPTDIQVTKTANQTEVTEPGGDVSYTIQIDNLTSESITLTSLIDDMFGDLNGQGTCSVPQTIAGSGSYSCDFTGPVSGEAGNTHVNTVTGTAEDNDGGEVSDSDSAQVLITDVVPTIQVTKTADPETIPAPLGGVTYTVVVENTSAEAVTLTQLVDDKFGDLNGAGNCVIGGVIAAGDSYSCSFVETIPGAAGDTHTNVITATVVDNEQNPVSESDDATVTFTEAPELYLVDPCTVGCDQPTVQGQLCNGDFDNAYTGTVDWQVFVDNTEIGNGTVEGVPAGECVALSAPQSGDGLYSIVASLVDEGGETLTTSCGPLSCQEEEPPSNPPSQPPVAPPTGNPSGVFIPVTGLDLNSNSLTSMLQTLGFALLSFGLVMHGFSIQGKRKDKKAK